MTRLALLASGFAWTAAATAAGSALLSVSSAAVSASGLPVNVRSGKDKLLNDVDTPLRIDIFDSNQWHDFVFRARISTRQDSDAFVDLWIDGRRVLSRQGPIGYESEYRQTRQGGSWPAKMEKRSTEFGRVVVVADREQRYGFEALRASVAR